MQKVITVFGTIASLMDNWWDAYHEYPEINNLLSKGFSIAQIIPNPVSGPDGTWVLTIKMERSPRKQKVITVMGAIGSFGREWPNVHHEYLEVNRLLSDGGKVVQIVPSTVSGPDGVWVVTFVIEPKGEGANFL